MEEDKYVIENAIVTSCCIFKDDGKVLNFKLSVNYGGACQSLTGWALFLPESFSHYKKETIAGFFIYRVLEICGVNTLEEAVGKAIRVKHSHSQINAIGHIIYDDWFCPSTDLEESEVKNA